MVGQIGNYSVNSENQVSLWDMSYEKKKRLEYICSTGFIYQYKSMFICKCIHIHTYMYAYKHTYAPTDKGI